MIHTKKITSWLLACLMIVSLIPIAIHADDGHEFVTPFALYEQTEPEIFTPDTFNFDTQHNCVSLKFAKHTEDASYDFMRVSGNGNGADGSRFTFPTDVEISKLPVMRVVYKANTEGTLGMDVYYTGLPTLTGRMWGLGADFNASETWTDLYYDFSANKPNGGENGTDTVAADFVWSNVQKLTKCELRPFGSTQAGDITGKTLDIAYIGFFADKASAEAYEFASKTPAVVTPVAMYDKDKLNIINVSNFDNISYSDASKSWTLTAPGTQNTNDNFGFDVNFTDLLFKDAKYAKFGIKLTNGNPVDSDNINCGVKYTKDGDAKSGRLWGHGTAMSSAKDTYKELILDINDTNGYKDGGDGNLVFADAVSSADTTINFLRFKPFGTTAGASVTDATVEFTYIAFFSTLEDATNYVYVPSEDAPKTYTVTFVADDAEFEKYENVVEGTALVYPTTTPTKEGYTFKGWDVAAGTEITSDLTVTAQFEAVDTHEHTFTKTIVRAASCEVRGVVKYSCSCGYSCFEQLPTHPNHAEVVIIDATCGSDGQKNIICADCKTIIEAGIAIPATGDHKLEDKIVEATCTEPAKVGKVCSVCGFATDLETVEGSTALDHDYKIEVIDADCTRGQRAEYTCSRCGDSYIEPTELADALGHKWDNGKVTAPTCTEGGFTTFTCTICGETEKREITNALNHDYKENVIAPTCGTTGYTEMICSRCGDKYTVEGSETAIDTDAHNIVAGDIIRAATCTSVGIARKTCSICSKTFGYMTVSVEHKWGEELVNADSTAVYHICTVCDTVEIIYTFDGYDPAVPVDHVHTYEDNITAPTCTEPGYTTHTCKCGKSYVSDEVSALGHTPAEAIRENETAATCTEAGSCVEVVNCARCNIELSRENKTLEALGHTPAEAIRENETAATCTEAGSYEEVVNCARCNTELSRESKTVEALGHSWDNGTVTTEPTEESDGVMTYTCTVCSTARTESIPKLAHTHAYEDNITAPTCTEPGYTTHTCKCGKSYVSDEVSALGHSWDNGTVTTEPTEESEGVMTYTCTVCSTARTESIPKLAHTHAYALTNVAYSSDFTAITYTYTCGKCGDSYTVTEKI